MTPALLDRDASIAVRSVVALAVGLAAAAAVVTADGLQYGIAAGWIAAAAVFLVWTWIVVGRMGPESTASHATREDPARPVTDAMVISASLASLVGVGYLLSAGSKTGSDADVAAALGICSVAAAWLVVHTVFTLRYARLYYENDSTGIDFNEKDYQPAFVDFAYLAFTIGMTYQVSDTDLTNRAIRATALRQALLSFVLGAVILATTVNLVAGLGNSGN